MSDAYTGGCACGAIRYEIHGEPMLMHDCHCRQCQRESGTGHASHLTFQDADVSVTGVATCWEVTGDGGTRKSCAFCPTCGSPVYMTFPDMPTMFSVRAASLDDPSRYRPQMIMWNVTSQPWDATNPSLPAFEKMAG